MQSSRILKVMHAKALFRFLPLLFGRGCPQGDRRATVGAQGLGLSVFNIDTIYGKKALTTVLVDTFGHAARLPREHRRAPMVPEPVLAQADRSALMKRKAEEQGFRSGSFHMINTAA